MFHLLLLVYVMILDNIYFLKKSPHMMILKNKLCGSAARLGRGMGRSRGGTGGPDPSGKSQVIWVSIGNKQLDPPPPLEKVGPPPP